MHRKDYNPDNFVRSTVDDFTDWKIVEGLPKRGDGTTREINQVTSNGKIIFVRSWVYSDENRNDVADFLMTENGDEWIRVRDALDYAQITFHGDNLYATAGNTLMMSADTGKTWTGLGDIKESLQIQELFSGANTMYAMVQNRSNNALKTIVSWDMENNKWNTVFSIETASYLNVHVRGTQIGAGNYNIGSYYSPDGGKTWVHLSLDEFKPYAAYIDGVFFYSTGPGSGFGESLRRISLSHFGVSTGTEKKTDIPSQITLDQNYPNPFNPTSTISFNTNQSGHVDLRIYNTLGQEVAVLVNSIKPAGSYTASVDLSGFSSGMYVYQLRFNGQIKTRKMTLLK